MSVTGARLRQIVVATAISLLLVVSVVQCTEPDASGDSGAGRAVVHRTPEGDLTIVDALTPADRALAVSSAMFASAEVVVLIDAETPTEALTTAHGVPVLDVAATDLVDELDRLGATTAVTLTANVPAVPDDVTIVDTTPAALATTLAEHVADEPAPAGDGAIVLTRDPAADALALANAPAATVVTVPTGDPRNDPAVAARLHELGDRPTLVLGADWVDPAYTLAAVRAGAEVPGGGYTIFPSRHIVALYGSPGTPALGVLGEQDPAATVARAQAQAEYYAGLSDRPVVPALEIIATIASSEPEADGSYSRHVSVEAIGELVDAAGAAGQFVILDLQPGRTDFLTQAKQYEELLLEPHVGLALDPEWRLLPDQVHLRQIGSVTGAEVDAVSAWLADLVREHDLPQKLFVLHQFTPTMITDRHLVQTHRPQLQTVIHVDGQGTPGGKTGTWNLVREGADPAIAWGWKNFLHEDLPMLTPEQTWAVVPRPDLVTYQ